MTTLSISGILPVRHHALPPDNPATGVLVLTGVASIANYQTALHQVVFSTADTVFNADRIISVTVNDGDRCEQHGADLHARGGARCNPCNGGHCRQFAH